MRDEICVHLQDFVEDFQILGNDFVAYDELKLSFDQPEPNNLAVVAGSAASLETAHKDVGVEHHSNPMLAGAHDLFLRLRYCRMSSSV